MSSSYLRFDKDSPEYQELVAWWLELDNNRGERAVLRRCRQPYRSGIFAGVSSFADGCIPFWHC